ncbi:hypothetical protein SUDANB21_02533 [Streptomyces sp. enrichment culture]
MSEANAPGAASSHQPRNDRGKKLSLGLSTFQLVSYIRK